MSESHLYSLTKEKIDCSTTYLRDIRTPPKRSEACLVRYMYPLTPLPLSLP